MNRWKAHHINKFEQNLHSNQGGVGLEPISFGTRSILPRRLCLKGVVFISRLGSFLCALGRLGGFLEGLVAHVAQERAHDRDCACQR